MQDQRLLEGGRIRSHSIHIDDRRLISVTGVKDVDSFNEQFVQLLTEAGELRIEGAELHITKLNLDEGQVMLEGEISALEYAEGEERGIPLGSAGIISALVLGFLEYWNLIEQPMAFLKTKSLWPLSLYLPQIDISQTGKAFAVSVLVLIPAVIVFLAGQDYLEQGIISTAIKE